MAGSNEERPGSLADGVCVQRLHRRWLSCPPSTTKAVSVSVALVWFRRDLRLQDNPALQAALDAGHDVVPVYIHGAP